MTYHHPLPDVSHHKRAASSVLKSFIHKRTPSSGIGLPSPSTKDVFISSPLFDSNHTMPFLPQDHPDSRPLGELVQNHHNQPPVPSKKSKDGKRPNDTDNASKSLHKKTLSSLSLKSLAGRDAEKPSKLKDENTSKPKKTKSSTNLSNLLSRQRSSKNLHKQAMENEDRPLRDKENRRPLSSSPDDTSSQPPPIFSQFSTQFFAKQPLGGKFLEDEIELYTPQQYSPGKQRNFYEGPSCLPTLTPRDGYTRRPKSTYLPSSFSIQDISRRQSADSSRETTELARNFSHGRVLNVESNGKPSSKPEKSVTTRGKTVLEAVSAFGARPKKVPEPDPVRETVLEDRDIDREFEAMLDRRNIPENQRSKMRSLAPSMKKDFVRQDWAETAAAKNGRPGTNGSDSSADATTGTHDDAEVKKKRPRSRTFTLSRASNKDPPSPTKKQRPEATLGRSSRNKSSESLNSGTKLTSTGVAVAQTLIAKAKGQLPDDFVSYLRKLRQPELVEVGRLHKLRLLLRNEIVAWTDEFIDKGGMEEIVGLLHRIIEVEWREEHEDALLHEVLLCLKALATTALAIQHLESIQSNLFPALLHMLFDAEKKGPSEFTTRNIISSLLFIYLKSARLSDRSNRAQTILAYLRGPEPTESERPVGFVLEMRRSRPYQVWCKEVVNVTKEVFWIFLHNLNVIALPDASSATSTKSLDAYNPDYQFMIKHFPQELPPVPAAPYVGGVEWDATNYLASHLDLLNGILAAIPTQTERNELREQLRVSGWEKCMGGTLRLCKEKFYGGVHAALRCWVAAATEDGWDTRDVRCGPSVENKSPLRKSPKKGAAVEDAPRIEMKLDFGRAVEKKALKEDAWL